MKDKPTLLAKSVTGSQATLRFTVDADLIYFEGHFDGHPILPGVAQIHWVVGYGRELLGLTGHFIGMEAVKFNNPILPNAIVTMALDWRSETNMLHFTLHSDSSTHSSGRIKLMDGPQP